MNVQLVSFFTASLVSTVYSNGAVEYCYHLPECDPSTWAKDIPHECSGKHQSPINIVTADVKANNNLKAFSFNGFDDNSTLVNIHNLGTTVKIELDDTKINVSGGGLQYKYKSLQFHFHWGKGSSVKGSEHTVDGSRYAMEMHIVNKADDLDNNHPMKYAVLGFFIEATDSSDTPESWKKLTSFLANISSKGETLDIMNHLSLNSLLEGVNLTKYYRYQGSLTTPTCNEIVVWTLFKTPIKVSSNLIDLFKNTVHVNTKDDPFIMENYRPLQDLNGRDVTSQESTSSYGPIAQHAPSASAPHHTLSTSKLLIYSILLFGVQFYPYQILMMSVCG